MSALVEVAELLGDWAAIRALEDRVRGAVGANVKTPCTRNARSLIVCALAEAQLGDDARARELERSAIEVDLPTRHVIDAPQLRLALVRGDHARGEELLTRHTDGDGWYARGIDVSFATLVTKLDAFAVLGKRAAVEELAPRVRLPGTYIQPFAQRALGIVRGDGDLIDAAAARFDVLGLSWHAGETRRLGGET